MKRALILYILLLCLVTFVPIGRSARDLNVMDDIGFDKSYGYYSSANETINMQSGNVILQIPVSPLYPGPEGSGLDLQLKLVYNSQTWKYRMRVVPTVPPEGSSNRYDYDALVDNNKMFYSPVGFGWRLHMGRLFRMKNMFAGGSSPCYSMQYFYEDPSGALHDFGPYCESEDGSHSGHENGTFRAQDGSGYVLQVENYNDVATRRIIMFDGTGRKYYFTDDNAISDDAQFLPYCFEYGGWGDDDINIDVEWSDRVFYLKKITDYNESDSIEIFYKTGFVYAPHLIDHIDAPFDRTLTFIYNSDEIAPRLMSISEPGFDSKLITYDFVYPQTTSAFDEPWGEADCVNGDGYCEGGVYVKGQIQLTQITLPEKDYWHSFVYDPGTGEIMSYTNPLGAETTYSFRNLITHLNGMEPFGEEDDAYCWRSRNPSRSLYRKVLDVNSTKHEWNYDFRTEFPLDPYQYAGVYDESGDNVNFTLTSYGGALPMTWGRDPDGNTIVYFWKLELFSCGGVNSMRPKTKWGDNDCPSEDNSYNGLLTKVMFFQGEVSRINLRKVEIINKEYDESLGWDIVPKAYEGSLDYNRMNCHDNERVFRKNIREYYKEIRTYGSTGEVGGYVSQRIKNDYDVYGNIKLIEESGDGLATVQTFREYEDNNQPESGKYKVDFLAVEYQVCAGQYLSGVSNEEYHIVNPDGSTCCYNGRVGVRTQLVDLIVDASGGITPVWATTEFDYDRESHELESETHENEPTIEYVFEYGALQSKKINELAIENYTIDSNTGLVCTSWDANDNATGLYYDGLNRLTDKDYPGPDNERYSLKIRYSEKYQITCSVGDAELEHFHLDPLGNICFHQKKMLTPDGIDFIDIKDSVYDWRLEKEAIYPGNSDGSKRIYYDYDYLGRVIRVDDADPVEEGAAPLETSVTYEIISNSSGPEKIQKTILDDLKIERQYFYDLRGNLLKVVAGEPAGTVEYEYDPKGNLVQVTHGSTIREFEYDLLNRLKRSDEPETGSTWFEYYADGKLKSKSPPDGSSEASIFYEYNSFNLLSAVQYIKDDQSLLVRSYGYGDQEITMPDGTELTIHNGNGRLTSMYDAQYNGNTIMGGVTLARSYNKLGDIESESTWMTSIDPGFRTLAYKTDYQYNAWGNIAQIKMPVSDIDIIYGSEVSGFHPSGTGPWTTNIEIRDLTHPDRLRSIVRNINYNSVGDLARLEYDNGVNLELAPDYANRIAELSAWRAVDGHGFIKDSYIYDGIGRITDINDELFGSSQKHFAYYQDGSLNAVTKQNQAFCFYNYDSSGNMTEQFVAGRPDLSFSQFRYVDNKLADQGFQYDENGNVSYNPLTEHAYCFSPENRLIGVDADDSGADDIRFIYDSDGRRRMTLENNKAELYFYDFTGNNLLEKLTFDLTDANLPKVVNHECFVNFGKNNVAQFDYFEPVLSIEFDDPNQSVFCPGEEINAYLKYDYEGQNQEVFLYIILDVGGSLYFYPSWGSDSGDIPKFNLETAGGRFNFLHIDAQESLPSLEGLYFYAGVTMSRPDENIMLFGNIAIKEFALSSGDPNKYVRPGPHNGTGDIGDPFNSIQAAINDSFPMENQRIVIKLFPGTYEIGNSIEISRRGIDIIGSGQNRTFITGSSPESSFALTNGADSTIQGMTCGINIACSGASPVVRDVRLLNIGGLVGVCAVSGSSPEIVNCLIADYYCGIVLEDSSSVIRNCTIDSCGISEIGYDGGGIICTRSLGYSAPINVTINETIITNNDIGIYASSNVSVLVSYSNLFDNTVNFDGLPSQIGLRGNISADPIFIHGRDHEYYLSSVSAGQTQNSPCIDKGFVSKDLARIITGTTRTDGIFDQCRADIGYHGPNFNQIVGRRNLNNDIFDVTDSQSILKAGATSLKATSVTAPDPRSILSNGPKDILVIQEGADGSREFKSYFQGPCSLQAQTSPLSPKNIIDASLNDLDGDGIPDLVVLEENGPTFFINDKTGTMLLDKSMSKQQSRAIETIDVNGDGIMDVMIATDQGVVVHLADDPLIYSEFQTLKSGDTVAFVLYDFDRDGDADMATIDARGSVRFYRNDRSSGFSEVGVPVLAHGAGKLRIQDANNDGRMDVVVEIAPGVDEIVEVGGAFGNQTPVPSGQRAIRFVLFDHLGTAKMLTNNQGIVDWPRTGSGPNELSPFGKDLDFDPAHPDPEEATYKLTFTNKEIDHRLDLHYFGARYYQATFPRFVSPDPVSGKLEIPLSWNRYLYCRNDPVSYFDPDGRVVESVWDAFSLGTGVVSLGVNLFSCNWFGAAWDVGGIVVDASALAIPGVPGGAGAALRATRAAEKVNDTVDSAKRAVSVYRSLNAAGEVQYIGITNNLARRAAEHLKSSGIIIEEVIGGLSRSDARAVEQVLIEIHGLSRNGGSLINRINSIAETNPIYASQLQNGLAILQRVGYE